MRRVLLVALTALTGCGGEPQPAREAARCPDPPASALRTLGDMREAARAVQGPPEVRRLAGEIAAAPADDWLGREDLLIQLAEQQTCGKEAAALAERLRVPHYRHVVQRLRRRHSLRDQLLHDWNIVVTRAKLSFAVDEYRLGLISSLGELRAVVPPRHVKAQHRRYLRTLDALHRRVVRLARLENRLATAQRVHATLPGLARAADREHGELMRAAAG